MLNDYKIDVKAPWDDMVFYEFEREFETFKEADAWLNCYVKLKEVKRDIGMDEKGYSILEDGYLVIKFYCPQNKLIKHIWFEAGSGYWEYYENNEYLADFWKYLK